MPLFKGNKRNAKINRDDNQGFNCLNRKGERGPYFSSNGIKKNNDCHEGERHRNDCRNKASVDTLVSLDEVFHWMVSLLNII